MVATRFGKICLDRRAIRPCRQAATLYPGKTSDRCLDRTLADSYYQYPSLRYLYRPLVSSRHPAYRMPADRIVEAQAAIRAGVYDFVPVAAFTCCVPTKLLDPVTS